MDLVDREILRLLQEDADLTARELAEHVGLTPTPCWRRVQNLERDGIITAKVALLDPARLNLAVTALVHIRTNDHSASWLDAFSAAIAELPEVVEAYRTSGEVDYTLNGVTHPIRFQNVELGYIDLERHIPIMVGGFGPRAQG